MVKRDERDIIADVLIIAAPKAPTDEYTTNGARKTIIMYDAGLSYKQLKPCIDFLVKKNFLGEKEGIFITTENGLEFLEKYYELKELVK